MRTTVRIDDGLLAEAKAYAARNNRSLTSVLEDALRELLQRQETHRDRPSVRLDVFHGTGLMPGVDLESSTRMHELLDDEAAEQYRIESSGNRHRSTARWPSRNRSATSRTRSW